MTASAEPVVPADTGPPARHAGGHWWTRRAVAAHVALAIWVPGCAVAAWWQVGIALGGDGLGWVYSVMWPCFAVFGIIFWWFLLHDDPERVGARGLRRQAADAHGHQGGTESTQGDPHIVGSGESARIAAAEAEDPELAQYNAYLARLAHQQKSWRRT